MFSDSVIITCFIVVILIILILAYYAQYYKRYGNLDIEEILDSYNGVKMKLSDMSEHYDENDHIFKSIQLCASKTYKQFSNMTPTISNIKCLYQYMIAQCDWSRIYDELDKYSNKSISESLQMLKTDIFELMSLIKNLGKSLEC